MSGEFSENQSTAQAVSISTVSKVVETEVLEQEYIPAHSSINIGWDAARTAFLLKNSTDTDERTKLTADLKENIGWGKMRLEYLENGGFSGGQFDKLRFDMELPYMNDYFKKKTGFEVGFLEKVGTAFKNKKGYKPAWKLADNSGEYVFDYVGMLVSKDESGEAIVPDEIVLEFFKGYNYVIAQKSLELNAAMPNVISNFMLGVELAAEKGVLPHIAVEKLPVIDTELEGVGFCDLIEYIRTGLDARNNKIVVSSTDSQGREKNQKMSSYLEFYRYGKQLGHMPFHELFHVIEGDCIKEIFDNAGQTIAEALTERMASSIFTDGDGVENEIGSVKAAEQISRRDYIENDNYTAERSLLNKMLDSAVNSNRLYELLTELYFTYRTELTDEDFSAKQQEVSRLISADVKSELIDIKPTQFK